MKKPPLYRRLFFIDFNQALRKLIDNITRIEYLVTTKASRWSLSIILYHSTRHILCIESFSPEYIGCNRRTVARAADNGDFLPLELIKFTGSLFELGEWYMDYITRYPAERSG